MTSHALGNPSEALDTLVARLARLLRHMEELQMTVEREMVGLKAEADEIIIGVRALTPAALETRHGEDNLSPSVPIPDDRLRRVWSVLYRHPGGATADSIARDLDRHRTTISTYLNTLVLMGFAEKTRHGHEILYTAIVKIDRAEN